MTPAEQQAVAAVSAIRRAVEDHGLNRVHHLKVMRETAKAWPTLWRAIEQAIVASRAVDRGATSVGDDVA